MSRTRWHAAVAIAALFALDRSVCSGWLPAAAAQDRVAGRIVPPAADDVRRNGMPDVWIGVRVTPMPEPLASHLQRAGLMVANVALDSPAERAGLQRYDVIVSFGGEPIGEMADLTAAIRTAGADRATDVIVVRGGAETTLRVAPSGARPDGLLRWRHDEPEIDAAPRSATNYFGETLRLGPDGDWVIEPLGQLRPDDLRAQFDQLYGGLDFWLQGGAPGGPADPHGWAFGFDPDLELEGTFVISESRDGHGLRIERDADGVLTVTRSDPAGAEDAAIYQDVDQLRDADPEAYELLRERAGARFRPRLRGPGNLDDLLQSQSRWQRDLRAQLERARRQLQDLQSPGVPGSDFQYDLRFEKDATGHYRVRINRNGEVHELEADSPEQLRDLLREVEQELRDEASVP